MKAFLTGSQVYGTPSKESDIDLVVCMTVSDVNTMVRVLTEKGEKPEHVDYGDGQSSIKIGSLNLLVCHTDKRYASWLLGTQVLMQERQTRHSPLTREHAIEVFSALREMLGLKNGKE